MEVDGAGAAGQLPAPSPPAGMDPSGGAADVAAALSPGADARLQQQEAQEGRVLPQWMSPLPPL